MVVTFSGIGGKYCAAAMPSKLIACANVKSLPIFDCNVAYEHINKSTIRDARR